MKNEKKLRCPLGIPGGMIATLIGLVGIVVNIMDFNWFNLAISAALFLLGAPFMRVTMMVHSANDRLDELEKQIKINK